MQIYLEMITIYKGVIDFWLLDLTIGDTQLAYL